MRSIGRSRYDGFNFSDRRRFSYRFSLNGVYALSRALSYNGNSAAFGNQPTDLRNYFAEHDFGPSPIDERHPASTDFVFDLPGKLKLAIVAQYGSARPYNAVGGIGDVYGFGGGQGATHAIVLNSDPENLLATAGPKD